jgi:hypothetical protein
MKVTFNIKSPWVYCPFFLLFCLVQTMAIVSTLQVFFGKYDLAAVICLAVLLAFYHRYPGRKLEELCDALTDVFSRMGPIFLGNEESSSVTAISEEEEEVDGDEEEVMESDDPADDIAVQIVASLNRAHEECLESPETDVHNFVHRLDHEGFASSVIHVNRKERMISIAAEKNLGRRVVRRLYSFGVSKKSIKLSTRTG